MLHEIVTQFKELSDALHFAGMIGCVSMHDRALQISSTAIEKYLGTNASLVFKKYV